MAIPVVRIRRAAEHITNSDAGGVTVENLAQFLGVKTRELGAVLSKSDGLGKELGIVSSGEALLARYRAAAARLAIRGEAVTRAALACELGLSNQSVANWVRHNAEKAAEIGVQPTTHASRRVAETVASLVL